MRQRDLWTFPRAERTLLVSRHAATASARCWRRTTTLSIQLEDTMAKGQQAKKDVKKKPEKTLKEKRAEKAAKKAMKG
jgi:hypothetical protein